MIPSPPQSPPPPPSAHTAHTPVHRSGAPSDRSRAGTANIYIAYFSLLFAPKINHTIYTQGYNIGLLKRK